MTEGPLPLRDENVLLAGVVEAISAGLELGPLAARIAGLIVTATQKPSVRLGRRYFEVK